MSPIYTVADTCSLVSLAIPLSHRNYDHNANPDPLRLFLSTHTVALPEQVLNGANELKGMAQYNDLEGCAASNIRQLSTYHTQDPLALGSAPDSLPNWGLDDGETAAILLANVANYDYMISDEFTNRGTISAKLGSPDWLSTPDLIVDFVSNGMMTKREGREVLNLIEKERSWTNQPYVQRLKRRHL